MKLVNAPAPRLTEGGDAVKFEWEIVRGAGPVPGPAGPI